MRERLRGTGSGVRWKREKGGECSRFDAYNNIIIFWSDGNENTRWCIAVRCGAVRCGICCSALYCVRCDGMGLSSSGDIERQ